MDFGDWDHIEINLDDMAEVFYKSLRQGGTAIVWYDLWKIGKVKAALEMAGFKDESVRLYGRKPTPSL